MNIKSVADFIDEHEIEIALKQASRADRFMVRDCVEKALSMSGLTLREAAVLMHADGELREEMYAVARTVKHGIYGSRVVLFAPLYISNLCTNECSYCAFRKENKAVRRRWLSQEEIAGQTRILIEQGYKRVLLVAGEAYPKNDFQYVLDSIATIYATKSGNGEIRRVHANVAPPTVEQFYALRSESRGVSVLPGKLPPAHVCSGAQVWQEGRLRLACHGDASRDGEWHRRCGHGRALWTL